MVSLLSVTEEKKMGQWGSDRKKKRGREDMTARGLGEGLRETSHTKCLIRLKLRSVCVCNTEAGIVSNSMLLYLCRGQILYASV